MSSKINLFDHTDSLPEIDGSNLIEVTVDKIIGFRSLKEHNFFELLLFLSGEGVIEINGISYTISAGTFCYLTPFHLSQLTVKGDLPLKYMVCKFDWGYISNERIYPIPQIQEVNLFLSVKPYVHCETDDFAMVLKAFEQLLTEYRQPQGSLSSLFIKTYVMSLCYLYMNLSDKYNQPVEKASLLMEF